MRLLNTIRYAGKKLREFDDAYSGRINRMYEGSNSAVRAAGALVGGGHPTFRKGATESEVMNYALPAMSAVPKYVMPTVGLGLAYKGAADIARSMTAEDDERYRQ